MLIRTRASVAILGLALFCTAAHGSAVVGYWDYVGSSSESGYNVYDFNVHNGAGDEVDFLNISFQMPGGSNMLAADADGVAAGPALDNSYFVDDELFTEGLVRRGFDAGAGTATGLYGAFERTPIDAGADAAVARLAIQASTSIHSVIVGGSPGASPSGPPAYGHVGATSDNAFAMALPGDANLDGFVDVSDLGILAGNWTNQAGWRTADFNADGIVDISDLGILAGNWQQQQLAPEPPAHMPEPLTMATFGLAGLAVWRKARKRFAA